MEDILLPVIVYIAVDGGVIEFQGTPRGDGYGCIQPNSIEPRLERIFHIAP